MARGCAAVESQYAEPQYAEAQYIEAPYVAPQYVEPAYVAPTYTDAVAPAQAEAVATYAPATSDSTWPSYLPSGSAPHGSGSTEPPAWS